MFRSALIVPLLLTTLLAGCDLFGDSAEKLVAAREADGRAIGGACRHAARAIEDCYALNKKADKASVFAGWRDMNDYMRENKIDPVLPQVQPSTAGGRPPKVDKTDKAEAKLEKAEPKLEPKPDGEPAETVLQVEKKPAKATPKPHGES